MSQRNSWSIWFAHWVSFVLSWNITMEPTQQSSREFNSVIHAESCQMKWKLFSVSKGKKTCLTILWKNEVVKRWELWMEHHWFWNIVIKINIDPFWVCFFGLVMITLQNSLQACEENFLRLLLGFFFFFLRLFFF